MSWIVGVGMVVVAVAVRALMGSPEDPREVQLVEYEARCKRKAERDRRAAKAAEVARADRARREAEAARAVEARRRARALPRAVMVRRRGD